MPLAPMTVPRLATGLLATTVLLSGCGGGGGDGGEPVSTPPSVSSVTVDRVSYGLVSTFTINGSRLGGDAGFFTTGCPSPVLLAGGTSTRQQISCTPSEAMSVRLSVTSANGSEVYATTYAVPKPRVALNTNYGQVLLELEPAAAPRTVDNFLAYVGSGFYSGTIFHRVIPGFVVQGGGYTGVAGGTLTPQVGVRSAIVLESNRGLSNLRGTIAMARGPAADSATSQFFVNTVNNTGLDYASAASPGYAVFGNVVSGLPLFDAMSTVNTGSIGLFDDVPVVNITLNSASRTQ